jgi:PAS domain S-box-containing protein
MPILIGAFGLSPKSPLKEEMGMINMQPDYLCGLYVGNKFSINYFNYNTRSWEPINVNSGLTSDGANAIFIDYEKNIWIASNRGVNKIVSRRFSNFQRENGLLEDEVTAVLEYEPGKFVLGHNHGITVYDGETFQKAFLSRGDESKPTLYRVLDMQLDSKGNVWLAMAWGGLAKVNPRSPRQVTWYGEAEGLPDNVICVWIDKSKNRDHIWVGTEKGIFYCADPSQGFTLKNIKPFSRPSARKIYGNSGKLRYIGTHREGLYVYDDKVNQWKKYQVPGNHKANDVYSLIKDSRGRLLIGTLDGVYILENEILKKFKSNDFQVDRPVYFILEDNKNRPWFGTDNGVVRWNGKEVRKYTTADGLIGHETNRAAGITDSKGRVWIGTLRGVSIYGEAFDFDESYRPSPKIQLLYVEAAGKNAPLSAPVQLAYKENTVTFHFRGISFLDETAIRFRHKLEGFEKEWSEEKYHYDQMIRYTNLPSGTYRFHVKARNALGIWSYAATSPEITILKPIYQKWWFYLMVFLVAGGVFYGIFQLISEKRQAVLLEKQVEERTDQLQALESRYRSLFEESKDMVFISTPDGTILDVNPAGLELFGIRSKEEVLGRTLVPEFYNNLEDRPAFREAIEKNGYVKDYELVLRRTDGNIITVLMTATVVRDEEGKITAYRGMLRDITEQKKLEQQLVHAQKMEAIGTLAGGIAHDFNNILGVIVGYTELLRDGMPEWSQMHKNADQIMIAAKRGADLVKQILTFSRRDERERKSLTLSRIVKESLKLLRSSLPATIEIRQDIRATSGTVLANATQIHQVMMNLAANAAYAMQESGGGILGVGLEEVYLDAEDVKKYDDIKAGPYLRLSISDTGQGIPKEVIKNIFEPFFTTKEVGEGTGMGLSVIHGIVKNHQGDISVYSEPGEGTTFHVLLPCIEDEAEPKRQSKENIPGGTERILFVDDETELVGACTQMLKGMGYDVKGESKPLEALEIFQKQPDRFDLVITDLTMPTMTGLQLANELKRLRSDIPVILCSGFTSAMTMEQIEAAGISDFIMKPIVKSKLAQVIRKVLDKDIHD